MIVEITMEGGVIQNVTLPQNVQLIVKDYDVEGYDDPFDHEQLKEDEDGNKYIESVYDDDDFLMDDHVSDTEK